MGCKRKREARAVAHVFLRAHGRRWRPSRANGFLATYAKKLSPTAVVPMELAAFLTVNSRFAVWSWAFSITFTSWGSMPVEGEGRQGEGEEALSQRTKGGVAA